MSESQNLSLHPEDQAALNALVDAGFDLRQIDPTHAPRAHRVAELLGLLDNLPAEDADDLLVERTLTAISQMRERENAERDAATIPGPMGPGFHWHDLVAVAAMVLITLSIAMPMLSHNRANAHKLACASNLAIAGGAFGQYAMEHRTQLPAVRARSGDPWLHIGSFDEEDYTQSNSAHVFVMISQQYLNAQTMTCPANDHGSVQVTLKMRDWPDARAISFSYQNQFGTQAGNDRSHWDDAQPIAVLADKNPLFTTTTTNHTQPENIISPNHARLGGQNVLLSNGTVAWLRVPTLANGDHIYHTRQVKKQYAGNELPADQFDSFLVP